MSPNRKKRQEAFGGRIRYESDPQAGLCAVHNWGVRKSGGFDVQQIITQKRPSRLEQRSEQYEPKQPAWTVPYWWAGAKEDKC